MRSYDEWVENYHFAEYFLPLPMTTTPPSNEFSLELEYFNRKLFEEMALPAKLLEPPIFYDLTDHEQREKAPDRYRGYNAIIRAYGRIP
jgi:hypothetical protein